jgi:hypothetical protein
MRILRILRIDFKDAADSCFISKLIINESAAKKQQ